ncbi:MAG: divergent PAP2 family protein [Treponema sp.]|nr:divergent PAP2 family protein [Treponema sp.]
MAPVASLKSLLENNIFLATAVSLCTAQIVKMLLFLLTNRGKKFWEAIETAIWRTGGMPSSHSAVVCSLTTSVAFTEGIASNLFIFCIWFSLIVLRDALGVRRSAGLLAKALNSLGKKFSDTSGVEYNAVKEIQGHTPLEVLVGAFLGIFIAVSFALI